MNLWKGGCIVFFLDFFSNVEFKGLELVLVFFVGGCRGLYIVFILISRF